MLYSVGCSKFGGTPPPLIHSGRVRNNWLFWTLSLIIYHPLMKAGWAPQQCEPPGGPTDAASSIGPWVTPRIVRIYTDTNRIPSKTPALLFPDVLQQLLGSFIRDLSSQAIPTQHPDRNGCIPSNNIIYYIQINKTKLKTKYSSTAHCAQGSRWPVRLWRTSKPTCVWVHRGYPPPHRTSLRYKVITMVSWRL